ncbi:MAG: chemotaxis protein CheX [Nitrospirae bacterium]|nr:chemotaxis protein CheX [Nitrospirota bacterium]MBF0591589.1 chemotaxis protein CheX [Nitrospirota bacterium]
MKVEFVNPFLESIVKVLSTMANTQAKPGRPFLKQESSAKGDVTGLIGLAGQQTKGSLAITFTEPAILHIASQMLGETFTTINNDVADAVGEITNMVTGGAKKLLSQQGYKFDLSIPSTIVGKDHIVSHKTKGPIVIVPFDTVAGKFFVEICFEK